MRRPPNLKLLATLAVTAIAVSFVAAPKARADQDWQCGIILCMANPAGPMAAGPSCVSDMNELTAWLADPFHSWPTCAGMGAGDSYSGPAILTGGGLGVEDGSVYVINTPGSKYPSVFINTGSGYQYLQNFTGKIRELENY